MTQVEFILLADNASAQDAHQLIWQQALRASNNGGLYIHTQGPQQSLALGQYFAATSAGHPIFTIAGTSATLIDDQDSIVISSEAEPDGSHHTLLNFSQLLPVFFSRFERLIELVTASENDRNTSRQRYLHYKRRGYPLSHRQI